MFGPFQRQNPLNRVKAISGDKSCLEPSLRVFPPRSSKSILRIYKFWFGAVQETVMHQPGRNSFAASTRSFAPLCCGSAAA